jgi:hypothetical protein
MPTEEITIRVDPKVALAYRAASDHDRRRLDVLLSLCLHDALSPPGSLEDLMREISRKARERGLIPEILESIMVNTLVYHGDPMTLELTDAMRHAIGERGGTPIVVVLRVIGRLPRSLMNQADACLKPALALP